MRTTDGIRTAVKNRLYDMGEDARVRVNMKAGWASYSLADFDRAIELYENEGLDLLLCEDLYDDGKSVFRVTANA